MTTATLQLNSQQQQAVEAAIQAVREGRPVYRIGGYAGTGKTTVARYIVEELGDVLCCAFTGKAAQRLREKGLPQTQTIHKTIYNFDPGDQKFYLKDDVPGSCFLIDEGSMISGELWDDLTSFGKPVIMLGDPGQLEPVGKDPRLMHTPDIILTQIHRQEAGSGIIQYATDIRQDRYEGLTTYPDVEIIAGRPQIKDLYTADIVLCGFNRTRITVNTLCRDLGGFSGPLCKGEQIIVLKNNYQVGVFNGQILTVSDVTDIGKYYINADCTTDDGIKLSLMLHRPQFNRPNLHNKLDNRGVVIADYGYCITCHKAQGSEWDRVMVIDEQCLMWKPRRWRYTAVTRAAKSLRHYYK